MRKIEFEVHYDGCEEPIDSGILSFEDDPTDEEIFEYISDKISGWITVHIADIIQN